MFKGKSAFDQPSSVSPYNIETKGTDELGKKVSDYKDESEGCQNCTTIK
ncbi:MAG: hypothetical protein ACJAQR_002070 [Bacteroidia bacterium]|jgi:hypothetical protein|tara:strand:+ start:25 stop:171 length:147 start_codon:yes stop_codon:yes gene_type:complete